MMSMKYLYKKVFWKKGEKAKERETERHSRTLLLLSPVVPMSPLRPLAPGIPVGPGGPLTPASPFSPGNPVNQSILRRRANFDALKATFM